MASRSVRRHFRCVSVNLGPPSFLTWRHPSLHPLLCISASTRNFLYLGKHVFVVLWTPCNFLRGLCKCGCVFYHAEIFG